VHYVRACYATVENSDLIIDGSDTIFATSR
jgi:hypothetical protein